jgi:hypothetical protein
MTDLNCLFQLGYLCKRKPHLKKTNPRDSADAGIFTRLFGLGEKGKQLDSINDFT